MSPIQRDGIHAYILLPREFKRQRRSSRLKAIQSLFFLPSSPPNSFWAIKFKNSNVHYNLWGCSTSNSLEMLCSMSLNFFFLGSGKAWEHSFFFGGGGGKIGGHCMFDMTLPLMVYAKPCSFFSVCLVGLSCWGRQDSGTISDSLVKEPTASYVALQNQNAFARPNCPFIISATKVKCVCSFKDKVAVKWHTVGQYIWAGQMKTFPRFFPEGCSSDVKGC